MCILEIANNTLHPSVHIFKSKRDKSFKVTLCNKNHDGHMVGDGVYGSYPTVRKMTETSQKRVLELEGVGASRRRTADVLGEETGSPLYFYFNIYLLFEIIRHDLQFQRHS